MDEDIFELPTKYRLPYWICAIATLILTCYVKDFAFSGGNFIYLLIYLLGAMSIADFLFNKTMIVPGGYIELSKHGNIRLFILIVVVIPMVILSLAMI